MGISKSELKRKIRDEAKRKLKGPSGGVTGPREYRERVERGRQDLLGKSRAGGGSAKAARIEGELTYLLNNYVPANDARIEMLIDQWRTSGDQSYDPSIRIKYRQAVQKHMRDSHAI